MFSRIIPEEVAVFVDLYSQGFTVGYIGEVTGRDRGSIRSHLNRSGVVLDQRTTSRKPVFLADGTRACYTCHTNPVEYVWGRVNRCRSCRLAYMSKQARIRDYGVTPEMFAMRLQEQGGTCALCPRTEHLTVDHDHDTGVVRGILCKGHNIGLGNLGDNIAGLEKALAYLRRSAP